MRKKVKWIVVALLVMLPTGLQAAFEYKSLFQAKIDAPIVDVATNPAEDLVFVLTPGQILIFSTDDRTVLDRIPVEAGFDRIAYQKEDRLVLTAQQPARLSLIRYSRVYEIDVKGRAVKGPPDAKATIVVFDDYQ